MTTHIWSLLFLLALLQCLNLQANVGEPDLPPVDTLNRKSNGYRGIWYMNQPSGDEYVSKDSRH